MAPIYFLHSAFEYFQRSTDRYHRIFQNRVPQIGFLMIKRSKRHNQRALRHDMGTPTIFQNHVSYIPTKTGTTFFENIPKLFKETYVGQKNTPAG